MMCRCEVYVPSLRGPSTDLDDFMPSRSRSTDRRWAPYLEKRANRWYVRVHIPADVRHCFDGKTRFLETLETESLAEANRRKVPKIAYFQSLIRDAQGKDRLTVEAAKWRTLLKDATSAKERDFILDMIREKAEEESWAGVPEDMKATPGISPEELREASATDADAQRFYGLASGQLLETEPLGGEWLAYRDDLADSTKVSHRKALKVLASHHPTVQEIDRRTAAEFVADVLTPGHSKATVGKYLSAYIGLWGWLQDQGYIPEDRSNPWNRQQVGRGRARKGRSQGSRRGYTEAEGAEFLRLLEARSAKYPDDLLVAQTAAVTGARIDEVCNLERGDVSEDPKRPGVVWIHIREGKTDNAPRSIPIVETEVAEKLAARAHSRDAGRIFPSLTPSTNGKLSSALSKRLGRVCDRVNKDPSLVANHSWRNRAATRMERGGVPVHIMETVSGRKREGEGLGRYSQGPSEDQMVAAVKAIGLPDASDTEERSDQGA
jgi:integrase